MDINNVVLNKFFSQSTFAELIRNKSNKPYFTVINRYLNESRSISNKNLISEIYRIMTSNYRNEYFYKNTLLNKLLLGRHGLNTTTALTEIPVNKSKADFVLINGRAVVYEIKTELDNLDRLDTQLNNYFKAFDNVCVVTCESNFERVQNMLEKTSAGICILTKKNTISVRKEPISDHSKLEFSTIFKILRKKEFENIIIDYYGGLPKTKQVNYYSECYKLFKSIPLERAYHYMVQELKKRRTIEFVEFNNNIPYELKFLMYFSKYNKEDYLKLNKFLNNNFGG